MMIRRSICVLLSSVTAGLSAGCVIRSVCYNDADCALGQVCDIPVGKGVGTCVKKCTADADCDRDELCDPATGKCVGVHCKTDDDCHPRFECIRGYCVSREPLVCPTGMVAIENQFCIDVYEASRPDAKINSAGVESTVATSRAGVLPWQVGNNAEALAACEAAAKTLCTERQWYMACSGPSERTYGYGSNYSATICNGIDKYCRCGSGSSCEARDPCPFPHCYHTCGANFHLDPTGDNTGCTNSYGIFDMNGNLWEHVLGGDETRIRGGAYNCSDSERLHRCDYIPGVWTPSARGFRCCSLGLPLDSLDGRPDDDGGGNSGTDGGD